MDKPNTETPRTENTTQLNTNISNTKELNTNVLNTYPIKSQQEENQDTIGYDELETYRQVIKENIEYDILSIKLKTDISMLNEILDLLTETVCTQKSSLVIAGDSYPSAVVKSKLLKLNSEHIEYVIDCMHSNTTDMQVFNPVLQRLNDIANSERFTRFMNAVINVMSAVANVVLWVFELAMDIGNFIADNWSVIGPIIEGLAAVLAILAGKWLIVTAATKIAVQAQELFNTIASLNPGIFIIIGIITAIYLLVAIINKVAGTSLSATGIIIGAFMATGADIANVFIGVYNFMEGIIIEIWNLYASLANFLGNVFNNPVKAVIRLFWDMFDFIAGIVQSVANMIDTILGTNLVGAISNFRTSLNSMVDGAIGKQTVYVQKYNQSDFQRDRIDPMQAFRNGYSFGENLANRFNNMLNMPDVSDFDTAFLGSITQNTANTDENTANIADKMSGLGADVEAIRAWAEKEAINQFTTAEIKVTMQNENRISSDMDIDGVINKFVEGISESMQMAAEGVYD